MIITQSRYWRNNASLCSLPLCIRDGSYSGNGPVYTWSRHHLVLDDLFAAGYDLDIRWPLRADDGKKCSPDRTRYRAYRCGGWFLGNGIIISQFGKQVDKETKKRVLAIIRERLEHATGHASILKTIIYRYVFQYCCTFPQATVTGYDIHHINERNQIAREQSKVYGNCVTDAWLKSTDDRICNLDKMTPADHKRLSNAEGDREFTNYRNGDHVGEGETAELIILQPAFSLGYSHLSDSGEDAHNLPVDKKLTISQQPNPPP